MLNFSISQPMSTADNALRLESCKRCWAKNLKRRNNESSLPLTLSCHYFVLVLCHPDDGAKAITFTIAGARQTSREKRAGESVCPRTSGTVTGGNDRRERQRSARQVEARLLQRW